MREKLRRFMQGRYGADQLSRFLTATGLVLIILNLFVHSNAITYLVMALLVYCYYRMFSRDYNRRYAENQKFLELKNRVVGFFRGGTRAFKDKEHCYFTCPGCGAVCRVPRGKGRIVITCPRCGNEIHGKS